MELPPKEGGIVMDGLMDRDSGPFYVALWTDVVSLVGLVLISVSCLIGLPGTMIVLIPVSDSFLSVDTIPLSMVFPLFRFKSCICIN